jgi:hypothetical protein
MSFFKQNSNAKRMNELSFSLNTVKGSNIKEIIVKSSKINKLISLDKADLQNISALKIKNSVINSYYSEILLVKKALEWLFNDTEDDYHKYISININCCNVYTINTLREWIDMWYSEEEKNVDNIKIKYFNNEIYSIFTNLKKCKYSLG